MALRVPCVLVVPPMVLFMSMAGPFCDSDLGSGGQCRGDGRPDLCLIDAERPDGDFSDPVLEEQDSGVGCAVDVRALLSILVAIPPVVGLLHAARGGVLVLPLVAALAVPPPAMGQVVATYESAHSDIQILEGRGDTDGSWDLAGLVHDERGVFPGMSSTISERSVIAQPKEILILGMGMVSTAPEVQPSLCQKAVGGGIDPWLWSYCWYFSCRSGAAAGDLHGGHFGRFWPVG